MIGIDKFAVTKRKIDTCVSQIWGWWGFFLFVKDNTTKDPAEKAFAVAKNGSDSCVSQIWGGGFFLFAEDNVEYPAEKALCHSNKKQEGMGQVLAFFLQNICCG